MKVLPVYLIFLLLAFCPSIDSAEAQDTKDIPWGDVIVESQMGSNSLSEIALMVLPDGSGSPFTLARYFDGSVSQIVDGTITARLLDSNTLDPLPDFPREDVWLESQDGNLVICPGGNLADQDTDANGETLWRLPLRAGGWNRSGLFVNCVGIHLRDRILPLMINSPDIDGDLRINLTDVALFSSDFFGEYHFRSDFDTNLQVDLIDVTRMAAAWGKSCP